MVLINVVVPVHTMAFFGVAIEFAKMDILDAGNTYTTAFNLTETQPYNDRFNSFGIGSMNFLENSGSIFPIACILLVHAFSKFLLSRMLLHCARNKWCRKVGSRAYV